VIPDGLQPPKNTELFDVFVGRGTLVCTCTGEVFSQAADVVRLPIEGGLPPSDKCSKPGERVGSPFTTPGRGPWAVGRGKPAAVFQRRMESYVLAIMSDYGLPAEWAHKRAWRPLEHSLDTEGVFLRGVFAEDAEVGRVCYARGHPTRPGSGWIYRLDIDPAFRSRGYGTATVALVEAELGARGVRRIGTAVPGCNAGAQRLADRLGYAQTAQQMSKYLSAVHRR
jgi:RimJ/RimL family protein N-acetyltransferase